MSAFQHYELKRSFFSFRPKWRIWMILFLARIFLFSIFFMFKTYLGLCSFLFLNIKIDFLSRSGSKKWMWLNALGSIFPLCLVCIKEKKMFPELYNSIIKMVNLCSSNRKVFCQWTWNENKKSERKMYKKTFFYVLSGDVLCKIKIKIRKNKKR